MPLNPPSPPTTTHAGLATTLLVLLVDFPPGTAMGASLLHPAPRRCARATDHRAMVLHARLAPRRSKSNNWALNSCLARIYVTPPWQVSGNILARRAGHQDANQTSTTSVASSPINPITVYSFIPFQLDLKMWDD